MASYNHSTARNPVNLHFGGLGETATQKKVLTLRSLLEQACALAEELALSDHLASAFLKFGAPSEVERLLLHHQATILEKAHPGSTDGLAHKLDEDLLLASIGAYALERMGQAPPPSGAE